MTLTTVLQIAVVVIPLVAALVPLAIFAQGTVIAARNRTAEGRRADWKRIQELMTILTNVPPAGGGLWNQMLAVSELADFEDQQNSIYAAAVNAREHFNAANSTALVTRLDALIEALESDRIRD